MKNYLRVILVVLVMACAVCASYAIADKTSKSNDYAKNSITTTKEAVTEKNMDEKIQLFASAKDDYYLYRQGTKVILEHGGKEYEFDNWSKYMTLEKPTVYATDLDGNGDLELIVRTVGNVDKDGNYYHYAYVLNDRKDENGEINYCVAAFTQSAVFSMIDDMVVSEVSQLPNSKGTGVFAMCMNYTTIKYDKTTGIPDEESYYNLFKALKDENGQYMNISNWKKGLADFQVVENAILVNMPITMTYSNGTSQKVGYVRCGFNMNEDNSINVYPGTFVFEPNEEYRVFSYDISTNDEYHIATNNTNKTIPADKVINYITFDTSLNGKKTAKSDFSRFGNDMNCISKVVTANDYIEFVAKKGCRFNQQLADKNAFSIMMTAYDKNTIYTIDVGNVATISTDKNGNEVLRITYDKRYNKDVVTSIKVTFGEK